MKKIYYIVGTLLLLAVGACNNYLDILPDDKPTLDDAFTDAFNAEKYLFTCYAYLPSVANPTNTLGLTGGGDIVYSSEDVAGTLSGGRPSPMRARFDGNVVSNPYMNFWDGQRGAPSCLWDGIRHCNVFLDKILVENGGPRDLSDEKREQWIAEVKTLNAYYHFYLFRLYGPIPIMDKAQDISDKDDAVMVYRAPVDEVVDYIVNLLDETIPGLPEKMEMDNATEYGRFNSTIARCIKAQTLVLAASPLFNNNNYYKGVVDNRGVELFPEGDVQARWERALIACDSACRSAEENGAIIYITTDGGNNAISGTNIMNIPDTLKDMVSLRQAVTKSWNEEVIWATNQNTKTLQQFASMMSNSEWGNTNGASGSELGQRHGPTMDVVERFYTSNGLPMEEDQDWADNAWYSNRYKTQVATVNNSEYLISPGEETAILHFNRSLRFYASVGFDGGLWEGRKESLANTSVAKFMKGQGCGAKNYGGYGNFCPTGYLAKKMVHLESDMSSEKVDFVEVLYSFPIIRLGDMYLLLAECLNEAGGPSKTDSKGRNACSYLDEIRARVGLGGVVESWRDHASSEYKNKPASQNGLRDIIRQERMNELAFEGSFYYDVRRWLIAEDLLNRTVTGWNMNGETKNEFYSIAVIEQPRFSMKDYLMPIKTSTILQNPNLVQNPGW
ncbi:MAG: RagB/SusD family nutrient uptake outer membrane protein [Bacteroidales bacterium]